MKLSIKRFIDCYVPTEICNFSCGYCYLKQKGKGNGVINPIEHSPSEIRKALSMKRWGGIVFMNFCAAGETLLGDDILPIIHELLKEGHVIQIVTNGSAKRRFEEIMSWDRELLDRLFIKFSFHYLELCRLNLLEEFFDTIQKVRNSGISISLEITPCDELIEHIPAIKEISLKKLGALPHVTVARNERTDKFEILTETPEDEYRRIWDEFDSPMFSMKMDLLKKKRTEFCYGGEWTFYLNLGNGVLKQCYRGEMIDNIYRNVNEPIHFRPIGRCCPEHYCYNGHAWMALGAVPEADVISYREVRDRICADGSNWLTPTIQKAFSQKLRNEHPIYSETNLHKIVLLGDSICAGYAPFVEKGLKEKAIIFHPTDVGRFSSYFLRYLAEWAHNLKIGSDIEVVHFNVGLWDILRIYGDEPLVDLDSYKKNLVRIMERMKYVFPNARYVFATTTRVNEEETDYSLLRRNSDVEEYNEAARMILSGYEVEINDIYSLTQSFSTSYYLDMVHFTDEGYQKIGEFIVEKINRIITV